MNSHSHNQAQHRHPYPMNGSTNNMYQKSKDSEAIQVQLPSYDNFKKLCQKINILETNQNEIRDKLKELMRSTK